MIMTKPFSLHPLLHLARQKNDAAIKNLGKLNQQQQAALTKLATLKQYRKDYQEKFQEAAKLGMASTDLRIPPHKSGSQLADRPALWNLLDTAPPLPEAASQLRLGKSPACAASTNALAWRY